MRLPTISSCRPPSRSRRLPRHRSSTPPASRARLVEGACSDAIAAHIVDGYDLGGLQPAEIEAFETQGEDPVAHLVRAAVTLALTVRHGTACTPELRELEIDPSHLRHDWRRELAREMAVRAQKLLAETRYVEASALSGLRAKNLAVVSTVPRDPARGDRSSATATAQPSAPESRFGLGLGSTLLRLLMAGGGVLVLALLFSSLGGGRESFSRTDLAEISPFLESGHLVEMASATRFVGKLNRGWQYLEAPDRAAVATEIGEVFSGRGVESVVLTRAGLEEARYRGGEVAHVTPRQSAPATP
jgi:hypothetical protein